MVEKDAGCQSQTLVIHSSKFTLHFALIALAYQTFQSYETSGMFPAVVNLFFKSFCVRKHDREVFFSSLLYLVRWLLSESQLKRV